MRMHRSIWIAPLLFIAFKAIYAASQAPAQVPPPNTPNPSNPGIIEIAHPESFSNVVAISDVHGMYDPVMTLLLSTGVINKQGHWNLGGSLLLVVGDSIDKGPKSIEVLDLWMQLSNEAEQAGGKVIHLLGNHEAEFLASPEDAKKAVELINELRSRGMSLDEVTALSSPRGRFIRNMPVAARVGTWLFCHAGFIEQTLPNVRDLARRLLAAGDYGNPFFVGDTSLLEAKEWWTSASPTRQKLLTRLSESGLVGVVFGHQPKAMNVEGASAISNDHRMIKIDNGMAPQAGSHPGSVLIFARPAQLNAPNSAPDVLTWRSQAPSPEAIQTEK